MGTDKNGAKRLEPGPSDSCKLCISRRMSPLYRVIKLVECDETKDNKGRKVPFSAKGDRIYLRRRFRGMLSCRSTKAME